MQTKSAHFRQSVYHEVIRAGGRAKLNPPGLATVTPHDLRHSTAGLLVAAGVTAPTACSILRHANPTVTLTFYARLSAAGQEQRREDLERAFAK